MCCSSLLCRCAASIRCVGLLHVVAMADVPVLPNNMRRDVRSGQRLPAEAPMQSSVYSELVVDSAFWNVVLKRYGIASAEARMQPQPALLKSALASHTARSQAPEALVLQEFANEVGDVPGTALPEALAALGADCTPRLASALLFNCGGNGATALSQEQFTMLADAIRGAASQAVLASRLRSRTPERDMAVKKQILSDGMSCGSSAAGTPRGRSRSPSLATGRRRSPSASSRCSARSGTHTLKSMARLNEQRRRQVDENSAACSTPRHRSVTPRRLSLNPASPAANSKPHVPEPTLDGHKCLGPQHRKAHAGPKPRNALATGSSISTNRFDVCRFRF